MSLEAKQVDLENSDLKESALMIGIHKVGAEKVGQVGFTVEAGSCHLIEEIQQMEVGEKDVWIVTYPRSGTTWTQEMIWNIRNGVDVERSKQVDIDEKFYFLDLDFLKVDGERCNNIENAKNYLGKERNIKSHLPFSLLPANLLDKAKVVYVARNPKDVVVSYYHHQRLIKSSDLELEFNDFVRLFMAELLPEDPYASHLKEGWTLRDHKNILFLWYEDMKRDLKEAILKLSRFLEKELSEQVDKLSEQEVKTLMDHVSIENMKKNPAVNGWDRHASGSFRDGEAFVREGKSGGWRKYFSKELEKEFDEWVDQAFQESGIQFNYM